MDIIKEYLISIGFNVDKQSFDTANKAVSTLDKIVQRFKKSFAENAALKKFSAYLDKVLERASTQLAKFVASSEGLILGAIAAISVAVLALGTILTLAMGKFMTSMAKADMQIQIFARRMFTTVANARSLKAVMDSMGLKDIDELKDVALNPELRKQFFELRQLTAGLTLGADTNQGMKNIRAMNLEFQKLGIIFNYFWANLAGKLGAVLAGPLRDIQNVMAQFNKFLVFATPRISHDLAGIIGIAYKLIEVGIKLSTLWMRIPLIGKLINEQLDNLGALLDILNALMDMVNRIVDKLSSKMPWDTPDPADTYKDQQKSMDSVVYYLHKISDLMALAWNKLVHFFGPIKAWAKEKLGWLSNLISPPAEASTSPGSTQGTVANGRGHLRYLAGVQTSPNIRRYLSRLEDRLQENYTVTAGVATAGHVSHAGGNAVDIGLGGKPDSSIVALMKQVLSTPGLRMANLELSLSHYHKILKDLDRQGVNYAGRVADEHSRFSHGDHLHVGLQPMEVSINVHGAHDPKAVAEMVHRKFQEVAMCTTRTQQGSFA